MYAALGASTTDDEPDPGRQIGVDSEFLLNPAGTAAGNVTFYPKVNVLVAGTDVWGSLTDAQRDVLTKAAAETLAWTEGQRARRSRRRAGILRPGRRRSPR